MVEERNNLKYRVGARTEEPARSVTWYEAIFENAPEAALILDRRGIIITASAKIVDYCPVNPSDLIGTPFYSLPFSDKKALYEKINDLGMGESCVLEEALARKTGSDISIELSIKVIPIEDEVFIHVCLRNINEKKRYQEQVFATQKLESIAILAGGMVHDFRNLITAVLAYLEILRIGILSKEKIKDRTDVIEGKLRRASHMITHLLGFARNDLEKVSDIDVNELIIDSANLFELVLQEDVSIMLYLQDPLPAVEGDANQMENVILNLLSNARDAMLEGGEITVVTSRIAVTEPGEKSLPIGRYVDVEISDTGSGIPEEIRNKVFEPFFTTKPLGKGSGLGLSMVYGVIKAAKGEIEIESEAGKGTTMKIYLPAHDRQGPFPASTAKASDGGSRRILLVIEDEEVSRFVADNLESHGYTVVVTGGPSETLGKFRNNQEKIDLVITDVVMLRIADNELAKDIRRIKPDTRILMISAHTGYVKDKSKRRSAIHRKPPDEHNLLLAVRRALDEDNELLPAAAK